MKQFRLTAIAMAVISIAAIQPAVSAEHTESDFTSIIYATDSTESYTAENITVNVSSGSDAVWAGTGKTINLGGDATKTITINATGSDMDDAVSTYGQNNSLVIKAQDSVTITSATYGLWGQSNTQTAERPSTAGSLYVSAANVSIEAVDSAIIAFSNSLVDISGDSISITSTGNGIALDTRGNSVLNVNADGSASNVTINGDVVFETPNSPGDAQNSGNIINSYVTVVLSGESSSWTGRSYQEYKVDGEYVKNVELNAEPYYGNVTGFALTVTDGAAWNMTADSFVNDITVSNNGAVVASDAVSTVNIDTASISNGVLTLAGTGTSVNINTLSGTGGTVNAAATVADNVISSGSVNVAAVAEGASPALSVQLTGVTADDISDASAAMESLSVISGDAASAVAVTTTIAEGDINGAITSTSAPGSSAPTVSQQSNTKLGAYQSVDAISMTLLRHDLNNLSKRMGELRDAPQGVGTWARIYGSEQTYGAQNVKTKSTSVQVGADADVGSGWKVGGAFIYTNGSSDYASGDSDMDAYSVAAYGTWFGDNGLYADVIGKYTRMDTDYAMSNMTGDYSNNAFTLSVEGGWNIAFAERAFVEPQVEFSYGIVKGDDTTASNGVRLEQDDYETFTGRVGFRTGFKFPENKGLVYVRASAVYDFLGDLELTATKGTNSAYVKDDLGGFWVEYGVGANFNFTDRTYGYVDLERTSGAEVNENFRWNVGIRHTW